MESTVNEYVYARTDRPPESSCELRTPLSKQLSVYVSSICGYDFFFFFNTRLRLLTNFLHNKLVFALNFCFFSFYYYSCFRYNYYNYYYINNFVALCWYRDDVSRTSKRSSCTFLPSRHF